MSVFVCVCDVCVRLKRTAVIGGGRRRGALPTLCVLDFFDCECMITHMTFCTIV